MSSSSAAVLRDWPRPLRRRRAACRISCSRRALVNSLLHCPTDMVFFDARAARDRRLPFVSRREADAQEALQYTAASPIPLRSTSRSTSRSRDWRCRWRVSRDLAAETQRVRLRQSRHVVVATGAYDVMNRLACRADLPHVSHYYDGRTRSPAPRGRRRRQNSAAEAALDLYRNGATVVLVHAARRWAVDQVGQARYREPHQEGSILTARFSTRVVEITPARGRRQAGRASRGACRRRAADDGLSIRRPLSDGRRIDPRWALPSQSTRSSRRAQFVCDWACVAGSQAAASS